MNNNRYNFIIKNFISSSFVFIVSFISYLLTDKFIIGILSFILLQIFNIFYLSKQLSTTANKIVEYSVEASKGELHSNRIINEDIIIPEIKKDLTKLSKTIEKKEKSNLERKSELEAIITSINQGLIAINTQNEIKVYNKEFINIYNLDNDKSYNTNQIFKIDQNLKKIKDLIHEDKRARIKNHHLRDDLVVSYKGTKILSKDNDLIGYLILVEDVSEIYELEGMRTNFVSNVTHELKTPLTSIKGFSETLKNVSIDDIETRNKFLSIIEIEADRLTNLINDILLLQEIEEIKTPNLNPINISDVLLKSVALLENQANENISLNLDIDENLFAIAEESRLNQVFINLISNSIKYTNEGTIDIILKENSEGVIFRIIDTGLGIPKDALEKIFERFYRVDKARDRKRGGTGLGLSIVKHICTLFEAPIEIKSDTGVGTSIKVIFKK